MALTGLQIQKLLPGTNCKDCGSNTCMAFAMKLASKKADISACPHASDEAIATLGAATEPPVRPIMLGEKNNVKLGDETVLYRHEKTFVNQTAIAIELSDSNSAETNEVLIDKINSYMYERVGEELFIDMIAITQNNKDDESFIALIEMVISKTDKPLLVKSDSKQVIQKASTILKGKRCMMYIADIATLNEIQNDITDNGHVIVVGNTNINTVAKTTADLRENGVKDIIIDHQPENLALEFQVNSIIRKSAIKDGLKSLGFPTLKYINEGDIATDTVVAVTEITKYGSVIVLPYFNEAQLASLLTMRLNIYTDPQKPIQVEPQLYPIGEPNESSPVFVTTNFSLTYFVVSGEIENSGLSAWLLVPECEGMSVLTAWAAGKFSAVTISKFMQDLELDTKISSKKIIIPGYVAQISGELEDLCKGWEIMVGPQEAADIESFIKMKLAG